jgi:CO dehydrogenase maturation factor
MKILVCGKGGSGKSTICALLAKTMAKAGLSVLLIDADESNFGLHRLLGASLPVNLMENMGGRRGAKEKLWSEKTETACENPFHDKMKIEDIPRSCIAEADGVKLLLMGKIESFGEGCACIIGALSKSVLAKLVEGPNSMVIIDAEAGLEHFGRRVDAACDLILGVIDPTFESLEMANKMTAMAKQADIDIFFVLNKVDAKVAAVMESRITSEKIAARLPKSEAILMDNLKGRALRADLTELDDLSRFLQAYQKPMRLNIT